MKFLLVLACLVVYANAHACLLFPQQRGSLTGEIFRNAGDDLCFHITDKPCGGTTSQTPQVTFQAGNNSYVLIQKNLDHYYSSNPGSWDLYILQDVSEGYRVGGIRDSYDFATFEVKQVPIYLPSDLGEGGAILQLVYTTNNPNAPEYFYQCADVYIRSARR